MKWANKNILHLCKTRKKNWKWRKSVNKILLYILWFTISTIQIGIQCVWKIDSNDMMHSSSNINDAMCLCVCGVSVFDANIFQQIKSLINWIYIDTRDTVGYFTLSQNNDINVKWLQYSKNKKQENKNFTG